MTFTPELPSKPVAGKRDAYWWKRDDTDAVPRLYEVCGIGNSAHAWVGGHWAPVCRLGGLWSGPLLAPDEAVSREVFAMEVEKAYVEGYTDCSAALNESAHAVRTCQGIDWKRSRAFRVASGAEPEGGV